MSPEVIETTGDWGTQPSRQTPLSLKVMLSAVEGAGGFSSIYTPGSWAQSGTASRNPRNSKIIFTSLREEIL
jgi:hypothetical protein